MLENKPGQTEIVFLVEEDIEGGYNARALGLPIFTQTDSIEELHDMIADAVHCHFNDNLQRIVRLHYVRDEVVYV
ncbi:2-oxoisovalerate dehydrogenase [bacterium]|nr:2-oxoisovalerate dehydrogenase [bacterium]